LALSTDSLPSELKTTISGAMPLGELLYRYRHVSLTRNNFIQARPVKINCYHQSLGEHEIIGTVEVLGSKGDHARNKANQVVHTCTQRVAVQLTDVPATLYFTDQVGFDGLERLDIYRDSD